MFIKYDLTSTKLNELDTEIKFDLAAGRASGAQLIALSMPAYDDQDLYSKVEGNIIKILRALAKSRSIEFFLPNSEINKEGTEQEFLKNKFQTFLYNETNGEKLYYVKL